MPSINVLRNLMKPSYVPVMTDKMLGRVVDVFRPVDTARWAQWASAHTSDASHLAVEVNSQLWDESITFAEDLRREAGERLATLGVGLGGGGHYALLYFLTRLRRPEVVVETGVAAGYSSRAILEALERNGRGHLYSTDFPYFRLEDPERFIGILVAERLRHRWTLRTRGDRRGLAEICAEVDHIDLFHYDSDKRHSGRSRAIRAVAPRMDEKSLMLMDDIQDDAFFHDYVNDKVGQWKVFGFQGKYVGLVGQVAGEVGPRNQDEPQTS